MMENRHKKGTALSYDSNEENFGYLTEAEETNTDAFNANRSIYHFKNYQLTFESDLSEKAEKQPPL